MNISILNTLDSYSGAAIAAYRLLKGLRLLNHDVVMVVMHKQTKQPYIYPVSLPSPQAEIERKIFRNIRQKEIEENRTPLSNTRFSFPYPGYDLSDTEVIRRSDIINLHWVAEFQSVETIARLLETGKPVVWTLHDVNAFTGGCHYSAGCEKYTENCRDCPQLMDNHYQIPFHVLENKIDSWWKNLTIVTPSRWLGECARQSRLFRNSRVEVVPNSLETDIFKPKKQKQARKEIKSNPQALTLLFGAATGNEKRKGFYKLLEAMKYCLQDTTFRNLAINGRIKVLTFGPPQEDLEKLAIKIKSLGYVHDNEHLAAIYSAADLFILPSLEDNLPNTVLEAMACGTPVIAFNIGGIPDMIENGVTGYMAPGFDTREMGAAILKLLFDEDKRKQMSLNCRQVIEQKFKLQDQAGLYLELFHDLLPGNGDRKTVREGDSGVHGACGNFAVKEEEILLTNYESKVHHDFLDLYRKWAFQVYIDNKSLSRKLRRYMKRFLKKVEKIIRKILP
jgi:glycosyltransferase involved in cell wall biosynthesis